MNPFALNDAYRGKDVILGISQRSAQGAGSGIDGMTALIVLRGLVIRARVGSICRRGVGVGKLLWWFV